MKTTKSSKKRFLLGLSVSLVLAMAVGSFAISETQANTQMETQSLAATNADTGDFVVEGGSYGETADYHFESTTDPGSGNEDRVLYIHPQNAGTKITISNEGTTTDRIEVTKAATILLAGVDIEEPPLGAPLKIQDNAEFNVNIMLKDNTENILTASSSGVSGAGLEKSDDKTTEADIAKLGTLTIQGPGSLTATGLTGIGGGEDKNGRNITITGATVTAVGKFMGAGIGGGFNEHRYAGDGSNIKIINNSNVNAYSELGGTGIGGGSNGSGSNITISDSRVIATGGNSTLFEGKDLIGAAAGIGAGVTKNGSKITITNSTVTATGGSGKEMSGDNGYLTSAAAIGGGGGWLKNGTWQNNPGTGSENQIDKSSILIAKGGEDSDSCSIETLQGFNEASGGSLAGIVFEQKTDSDVNAGRVYGNVVLSQDLEIPANLTIPAGSTISIKEDSEVTLSEKAGAKYIVEGTLQNDGIATLPDNIEVNAGGKITTLVNYDTQGGTIANYNEYKTYKDSSSSDAKAYGTLPSTTKSGYKFDNWYTKTTADGEKITATSSVLLNQHTLYARWLGAEHKVIIPTDPGGHGTIEVDPENPREGEEVTITLTPDEGYKPDGEPEVKDEDGNEIEVISTGNPNEYKFIMPDSDVTVSAKFVPDSTPTPPGPEPTPEPTPDPSVNPDGDGSSASSKTSDPFMDGIALALLGVATTGAILTRKLR